MKSFLTKGSKISAVFACVLMLAISSIAQTSLRDALDYDGDGKADHVVFRPSDNVWYVLKSTGGYIFQQFGLSNTDYMTPGDYDGDGIGDIAVWRDSDGVWYRLNSSDSTFTALQFGLSGDEPIGRDFDGDGKTDPAIVRRTNGVLVWYSLNSGDNSFSVRQFGLSTDFTAPGDYDGDGKFDHAVQRPGPTATSPATFYILESGGNGSTTVLNWGFSDDLVVPGDYDGDGKTDVAIVREGATPSDALIWYVLPSSNFNTAIIVSFGLTGSDLNAQNDYDGDGKTDFAIWRVTDGKFYVLQSTNSVMTVTLWGLGSDFPVASYDTH